MPKDPSTSKRPLRSGQTRSSNPTSPADSVLVAFGSALREARIARGLSRDDLAHLAKVDRSHIGCIERGDHNLPLLTILRLADALGLPIAQLMAKAKL